MNGKMLDGKPLYVALAQRKEARRAQLEARHQARNKMGGPGGPGGLPPQPMGFPQGPMFYNQPHGPPRGGNFMYPGPMGRGGWMAPMPSHPIPMGRGPMAYQLMPVPGNGGARGGGGERGPIPTGATGGNRPRGPPGAGPTGAGAADRSGGRGAAIPSAGRGGAPPTGPRVGGGGAPSVGPTGAYNLSANVRNPQGRAPAPTTSTGDAPEPSIGSAPTSSAQAPLTIKTLAAAPEKQKKQMIGEQLFPLIKAREPVLAGKITGMLLEMDNGELIHLLESGPALADKIAEAMAVLSAHETATEEEEGETTE